MKHIEFSLKENAIDSLIHGIEHYLKSDEQKDLKYAVLHIAQAVELFLKERLSREHFLLVFSKLEKANEQSKTITIDECILRLIAAKIDIDPDTSKAFRKLQEYRSQIQHFKIKLEKDEVTNEIGRALKYLEIFLGDELDIVVKDEINENLYTAYSQTVYTYEELLNKANEEINLLLPIGKDRLDYKLEFCPECGNETIIYPNPGSDDPSTVKCFFCKNQFDVKECGRCGGLIYYESEEAICSDCWEDIMK